MSTIPPLLALAAGRKPRPRKAPAFRPKEITLHCAVAKLLREHCLETSRWTHIGHGEVRDIRTAVKLKNMGLRKGMPYFALIAPSGVFHGLELKRQGAQLTVEQDDFRLHCIAHGIPYCVAYSLDDALEALSAWNCLRIVIPKRVKRDD